MKKIFFSRIIWFVFLLMPLTAQAFQTDCMGYCSKSRNCVPVINKGATVLNLKQDESFAVIYVPKNYKSGRIVLALHGTNGTPYDEINDEIPLADKYDYMAVGIQWHHKKRDEYYPVNKIYRIIDKTLQHIKQKYHNDLSKIAFVGFSRGAAVSYELAYFDLMHKKHFDLFMAHSGGIAHNLSITQKNEIKTDHFLKNLTEGTLGSRAMAGANFFLYSGDKDESWGIKMSLYVENAKKIIEKFGGRVVKYIRDPNGKHAGFRKNKKINEKALQYFIRLTP